MTGTETNIVTCNSLEYENSSLPTKSVGGLYITSPKDPLPMIDTNPPWFETA